MLCDKCGYENSVKDKNIEYIAWDIGVLNNYTDCWNSRGSPNIQRLSDRTLLSGPQWATIRVLINNTYDILWDEYCIEFKIIGAPNTSNAAVLNIYDTGSHNISLSSDKYYKIVITDKIYPYVNNTPLNPISYDNSGSTFQVQFCLRSEGVSLEFRDFVMYYL